MTTPHTTRLAILAGVRTPQAKSFGALADVSAVELGVHAAQGVMKRAGVAPTDIDEMVLGNVASPYDAANIARVIALKAGIPQDRIAHTVSRNCASGMESIIGGWQAIRDGRAKTVIVGGTESMSQVPWLTSNSLKQKLTAVAKSRSWWKRMGNFARLRPRDFRPTPGIELGLTDPVCGLNMGQTAEVLADEFSISRETQDQFALHSHQKAADAAKRGFLSGEIIPLNTGPTMLDSDVGPRENQSLEQLAKLRPIFQKDGTVTPGNSCPLTDGATALIVCDESAVSEFASEPLGFVTAYAIAGCDPKRMGLGPVFATHKLLKQTGMSINDFDLIEINEAFAAQVLACLEAFSSQTFASNDLNREQPIGEIDPNKLNINGGAIALGHPVGASGTRLVLTLARALKLQGLHRGLATLCVGGGQGFAVVVEAYKP